jgi:hypothetical protein
MACWPAGLVRLSVCYSATSEDEDTGLPSGCCAWAGVGVDGGGLQVVVVGNAWAGKWAARVARRRRCYDYLSWGLNGRGMQSRAAAKRRVSSTSGRSWGL